MIEVLRRWCLMPILLARQDCPSVLVRRPKTTIADAPTAIGDTLQVVWAADISLLLAAPPSLVSPQMNVSCRLGFRVIELSVAIVRLSRLLAHRSSLSQMMIGLQVALDLLPQLELATFGLATLNNLVRP